MHAPLPRSAFLLLTVLGSFVLSACSSTRVADEAAIAEAKKPPQPTMAAETVFFEGRVLVEVNLGRGFRPRMVRQNWKPNDRNAFGTVLYEDAAAREAAEEEEEGMFIPRMRNSTLPPVALRLRVSNQTSAPLEIEFIECKSSLGNFAVRPAKLTVAAGESAQPDPMNSLLGVSNEEIPVVVGLRLDGKLEKHELVLVRVARKAVTPPAAPAKP